MKAAVVRALATHIVSGQHKYYGMVHFVSDEAATEALISACMGPWGLECQTVSLTLSVGPVFALRQCGEAKPEIRPKRHMLLASNLDASEAQFTIDYRRGLPTLLALALGSIGEEMSPRK